MWFQISRAQQSIIVLASSEEKGVALIVLFSRSCYSFWCCAYFASQAFSKKSKVKIKNCFPWWWKISSSICFATEFQIILSEPSLNSSPLPFYTSKAKSFNKFLLLWLLLDCPRIFFLTQHSTIKGQSAK